MGLQNKLCKLKIGLKVYRSQFTQIALMLPNDSTCKTKTEYFCINSETNHSLHNYVISNKKKMFVIVKIKNQIKKKENYYLTTILVLTHADQFTSRIEWEYGKWTKN